MLDVLRGDADARNSAELTGRRRGAARGGAENAVNARSLRTCAEPHSQLHSRSSSPSRSRNTQFLDRIKKAYDRNPALANLLVDPEFADEVNGRQAAWRRVVALCVASGIACPSFSASLGYFGERRSAGTRARGRTSVRPPARPRKR